MELESFLNLKTNSETSTNPKTRDENEGTTSTNPKTKEENEGTSTNLKTQRRKWSLRHLSSVAFTVVVWSSLFGFNLPCLIFVVWVWSLLFGFDLPRAFVVSSLLWSSWVCCFFFMGLIFMVHGFYLGLLFLLGGFDLRFFIGLIFVICWVWSLFFCGFDLHGLWFLFGLFFVVFGELRLKFHMDNFSTTTLPTHGTRVLGTWVAIVNSSLKDSRC